MLLVAIFFAVVALGCVVLSAIGAIRQPVSEVVAQLIGALAGFVVFGSISLFFFHYYYVCSFERQQC